MRIHKRNGKYQQMSFDKIKARNNKLANDISLGKIKNIDTDLVSQKVIQQITDGISAEELDILSADICISMSIDNPSYGDLASRIYTNNLQKIASKTFVESMEELYKNDIINKDFIENLRKNKEIIGDYIVHNRDYLIDYFGLKTLEKGYLLNILNGKTKRLMETPQYMWMRVALALHGEDLEKVFETYDNLSLKNFTHATPTLFNAGTNRQQLSSCYLVDTEDSISGIFKTMGDIAQISKYAGGVGLTCSRIRAKDSIIRGTNGKSDGILPMLKVYNEIARYVNQAGKRNGSFACFLDVFHADIEEFLEMKKNTGDVNLRARDLFYGLWVSDLFMEKVEKDEDWYLMCPDQCKGLVDAYGEEFNNLYTSYIEKGMYRKKIRARDLWNSILVSQTETGTPYICYKDSVNKKNNQSNLGTITSSNLCVAPETMVLTDTGYHEIRSLKDQTINIWNGEKFTQTVIRKTGEKQKLIKVIFSNGSFLECTKYHKFYIQDGNDIVKLEAQKLRPGMSLIKTDFPTIKKETGHFSTNFVPLNSSLEDKQKWLHKVFNGNLQIETDNLKFLNDVKYVLQSIGYDPDVTIQGNLYKLYICAYSVLSCFSFNRKVYHKIDSIEDYGRVSDTYCFKEEERGMGIFNGIIAGNCVEIMLHHTAGEYAVCNITSICLGNCVENGEFNFEKLGKLARISTVNLNKVIDLNFYPTPETLNSNLAHRPIAIGVQGLYDAFVKLRLPFTSREAKELNKKIFECIQFNALKASCELAKNEGHYSSFKGSPSSKGIFQHNMWDIDEKELNYDWESLRKDVIKYGLRNSLVTALPPTASTANIMGNTSSFETITSNIFTRTVLSGNFPIVNKYLVNDLIKMNLWSLDIKDKIISANGSIQGIPEIPREIKELYKTTWETSQKDTIDMSADRSPFIDHSQSLNIFLANATIAKLSSMHFYGWKKGLKTGSYYIRSQPISGAEKITVQSKPNQEEALACSIDNKEACAMCEG